MRDKLRWGVIGSGGIARRRTIPEGIVPADNAELIAVYDVDPTINTCVAKAFDCHAAATLKELLAADIDAVYVASPPKAHAEQVIAAAKAGKHVLCEKPLGMTPHEADAMAAACQDAGVTLGTAFMMRFHSQHRAAARMIHEGKLGTLAFGRAQLSCWYPPVEGAWRQDPATGGGGALVDLGGHCIDLLEMFFGPARRVQCSIGHLVHAYRSEDAAAALLTFEGGAMATVDTFFCIPDASSKNVLELYGSGGSILARGTIGQAPAGEMVAYLSQAAGYDARQVRDGNAGFPIAPEPVNMYRAEVEEFGRAIRERRQPLNSAAAGVHSQKVLAACYESARTGQAVTVD